MNRIMLMAMIASVIGVASCAVPEVKTMSTKQVQFGKKHTVVNANASNSNQRPILFGITFGERKDYGELMQELQTRNDCDVLKDVQLTEVAAQYAGFGTQTTKVVGKCLQAN